ncbi:glycerophosphoryl diester phosphodiesterase [mine drainage metagenome]|uniref:Glycerophosphoryl diester phosphodiesterase n=1 Tax=mine drainage metagenome TaxID=410659 RepID=A0A1J5RGX2_9ZZZZ
MIDTELGSSPNPAQRIAHRGGGSLAPENTLAAFCAGLDAGLTAFECDVKLSADGVPFLLHDDLLDRTTTASGRASWKPWSRLARVDAGRKFDPRFGGERIPSLADLAGLVAGHEVWLNLEIKPDTDAGAALQADWGLRVARQAVRLWAGSPQQPCLSSFSIPALQGAQQAAPGLARAWLCERLPARWREVALALDLAALHLDASQCTPALIAEVQAQGLQLRAYTVDDPGEVARLLAAGVGVFTDALAA